MANYSYTTITSTTDLFIYPSPDLKVKNLTFKVNDQKVELEKTDVKILEKLTLERSIEFEMPNFGRFKNFKSIHLDPINFSDPEERTFEFKDSKIVIPCYRCSVLVKGNKNYILHTYNSRNRMDAFVTMIGSAFLYFTLSQTFLDFYKKSRKIKILPWEIKEYENKLLYLGPSRCIKLPMDNPIRKEVDYFNAALEPIDLREAVRRKLY